MVTREAETSRRRKSKWYQELTPGGWRWLNRKWKVPQKPLYNSALARLAEVAELADALHSGCSARQGVEVRVLSSAPILLSSLSLQ